MREEKNERSEIFVLNTADNKTNPCHLTTMDIDIDKLHDADQELNTLVEFEHKIEQDGKILD